MSLRILDRGENQDTCYCYWTQRAKEADVRDQSLITQASGHTCLLSELLSPSWMDHLPDELEGGEHKEGGEGVRNVERRPGKRLSHNAAGKT